MKRNHIHLAQGLPGHNGVISGTLSLLSSPLSLSFFSPFPQPTNPTIQSHLKGMRSSSQIFIYINIQAALSSGIRFFFSDNGVVLTAGDDKGFLKPEFFQRVENAKRQALSGWEGSGPVKAVDRVREEIVRGGGYETPPGQEDEKIVEEDIQRLQIG